MNKKTVRLLLVSLALLPSTLPADQYWDPDGAVAGSSIAGNWDTVTTNWSPTFFDAGDNTAWVQGNSAQFTIAANYAVTLTEPITNANITVSGTAGTLTISGTSVNSLNLASSAILSTGGRNVTLSVPINGPFDFIRIGAGTVTLSGASTYSGGSTVSAGTTSLGVDSVYSGASVTSGPFGTGSVTVGAAITMSATAARVLHNPLVLNANLTIAGSQKLTLTNGTFQLNLAGRTLTVNNTADTVMGDSLTDDGTARTLTKAGTGRLILAGSSPTFLGGITASAGTLVAGSETCFPTNNATTPNQITINGSTLDLNGFNVTVSRLGGNAAGSVLLGANTLTAGNDVNSAEFMGVISGSGGYVKVGAISQVLSGTNTFTGGITITAGSLYLPTNAVTGSPFALGAGTNTITITGTGRIGANRASPSISIVTNKVIINTLTAGLDAASGGDFILAGQVSGPGGFLRTTQGSGFTVLAVSNTFTGGVEIDARPFGMGDKNALGTGPLIIGNPTTAPGNTIELGSYNLDLIGSNAVTNSVAINQNFSFGTRNAFGLELSGPVVLAARTNTITTSGTALLKFSGVISGSGGINVVAAGNVLTLAGNNSYTAPTIVSQGTLALVGSGSVAGSSDIAVLSGATLDASGRTDGTLTVGAAKSVGGSGTIVASATGGLTLSGGGTDRWQLSALGINPGDFDNLTLSGGNLVLGGTSKLSVNFAGTATSPDGGDPFWSSAQSWTVLTLSGAANPGNSDFATVVNGIYTNGYFTTSVSAGNILLNFTPGAPPQPQLTSVIGAGTTSVTINFTAAIKGATYQLQYKNDLSDADWTVLGSVSGTGTTASIVDTTSPVPAKRFYRIVVQ